MNWYGNMKIAEQQPLSRSQVEQHLRDRGFDLERHLWDYDEETGTVYLRLYTPTGKLVGMQEYRPHISEKGGNDRGSGESWKKKRYFTTVPSEVYKPNRVWGFESVDDRPYVFLTEGVFDAAPIITFGYPALAVIGSDLSSSLEQQLSLLGKYYIGILDNDKGGGLSGGKHKIQAAVKRLGGKSFIVPDPYKDFGEFYQSDRESARKFLEEALINN